MKIVVRILLTLIVLAAIPLIAALFVKGDYTIEREITIARPRQQVYEYIKYIKNADNAYLALEETNPNETKLKWVIKGKRPYLMNLMSLFVEMNIDKLAGPKLDTHLARFRSHLEIAPAAPDDSDAALVAADAAADTAASKTTPAPAH